MFRFEDAVFALDNRDPASGANVLSRGIVGDVRGELVVASPLYKHHYNLATGRCLEDPDLPVAVHAARVSDGRVWVNTQMRASTLRKGRRRLVVIGNGMAGMRTVEELLKLAPETYDISVFGAEPHGNYNRILLSPVLSGEKRIEEIMLHPREWYAEHGVTLHAGDEVVAVDRRRRLVKSACGMQLEYDRLLFATGSKPDRAADPRQRPAGCRHLPRPRRRRRHAAGGEAWAHARPSSAAGCSGSKPRTACASAAWRSPSSIASTR